jgi:hypothetical protein
LKLSSERIDLDEQFMAGGRAALIDAYIALSESEPEAGLFRRLGICLHDSGDNERAKVAFKKAMSMDHSDTISKRRLMRIEFVPAPKKKVAKKKVVAAPEPAAVPTA